MARTKVISEAQKKKLQEIKDRYPWLSIISHEQFCQLWESDLFPVSNHPRLYKQVQANIENFLNSFHYALNKLPYSYQDKIVLSRNFDFFMNSMLDHLESIKNRKTIKKDSDGNEIPIQDFSYHIYQKFFNIGIQGLIKTMPKAFEPYLKSQIKPLLALMWSIAQFSKSVDPNIMPNLDFPAFLFSDPELNLIGYSL